MKNYRTETRILPLMKLPLYLYAFCLLYCGSLQAAQINVDEPPFNAVPDDGNDDSAAIGLAVEAASAGDTIVFSAGTYDLIGVVPNEKSRERHIGVFDKEGLTFRGAMQGEEPATILMRHVPSYDDPDFMKKRANLPYLFQAEDCSDLTIENFVMDNSPRYTTAGEIVAIDPAGKWLRVRVFNGLPYDSGAGCSAANVWTRSAIPELKKVGSLNNNASPGSWSVHGSPKDRILQLDADKGTIDLTKDIEVGELMSWHYGAAGNSQTLFSRIDGFTMRNIRLLHTLNNAFSMPFCNNLTLERFRLEPEPPQLAVGPRDAFHISRGTGTMIINDVDIKGVRMDPIVIRAAYGEVYNIESSTQFTILYSPNDVPIPSGSRIGFWSDDGEIHFATVSIATAFDDRSKKMKGFKVTSVDPLPEWVVVGTPIKCGAFLPDEVIITNCDFMDNAGCDVLAYVDNMSMRHNTHTRSMFPAILLGSNNSSAGICGTHITISDSVFTDCGWKYKNGAYGAIIMKNGSPHAPEAKLSDIRIINNQFQNTEQLPRTPAIYVNDVIGCEIKGNSFKNFFVDVLVNEADSAVITADVKLPQSS